MAELAAGAGAGLADGADAGGTESDFSPRKIRIATMILLGQTFATSILPLMALSYAMVPMTREFGWSRTEFQLANSALLLFGAMTLWPLGRLTDTVGARPIIILGTLGVGLATVLLQFVKSAPLGPLPRAWEFYALFALLGVFGSSGASWTKVTTALFTQNRGKAMAILGVEGTVARMILPWSMTTLILVYGWRGMFTTFGAVCLVCVPLIFLFLEEPGTRGLKPTLFPRKARAGDPARPAAVQFEGMSFPQVLRDWVFWMMLVGGLVSMVVGNGMMANIPASMIDRGFTLQNVGTADSIATFAGIPGVLIAGVLMDKLPTAKIAAPFHLVTALASYLMMVVTPRHGGEPMLIAARCLFMFSFTVSLPLTAYFMTRFFGLKAYAQLYGFMSMVQAACMSLAPPAFGYIYDRTHTYTLGFELMIATALFSAGVFTVLPRYRFSANIGAMPAPPKGPGGGGAAGTVPLAAG